MHDICDPCTAMYVSTSYLRLGAISPVMVADLMVQLTEMTTPKMDIPVGVRLFVGVEPEIWYTAQVQSGYWWKTC